MGKSKEYHLALQERQFFPSFDSTFTKKEAQEQGVKLTKSVLDSGEVDRYEFGANLARLAEVVNSAVAEYKKRIPDEKAKYLGVEFSPVSGATVINHSDDPVYVTMEEELKMRKELHKIALKSPTPIYDSYGNEVPKCSTSNRASSFTIKIL